MTASNFPNERRKHPRFLTRQVFFAVNSQLGMVENISLGGLAFRFIDRGAWQEDLAQHGILFGEDDLCLDGVPIRRLSGTGVSGKHGNPKKRVQRLRVQFNELTPRQRLLLEGFIDSHS